MTMKTPSTSTEIPNQLPPDALMPMKSMPSSCLSAERSASLPNALILPAFEVQGKKTLRIAMAAPAKAIDMKRRSFLEIGANFSGAISAGALSAVLSAEGMRTSGVRRLAQAKRIRRSKLPVSEASRWEMRSSTTATKKKAKPAEAARDTS